MEEFSLLGGASRGSFLCLPSATATTATASTTTASTSTSASMDHGKELATRNGEVEAAIKAKIMSHAQYPALVRAFIDCQKIGAPPEIAGELSAVARELEMHPSRRHEASSDPELDQFMEAYCNMLLKYREELTGPIREATDFFRGVEAQLSSFFASDEKCEGVESSQEDQGASTGGEANFPEISPCAEEDKELKNHLLSKYGGYLSSLWKELSKKKKRGKLPQDSRRKLLHWWELHYRWPYPSEMEKAALAASTGLDTKQINNWFINQRKRHWKPTEDPPFANVDRLHPPNAANAAFYMDGEFMGDKHIPSWPMIYGRR